MTMIASLISGFVGLVVYRLDPQTEQKDLITVQPASTALSW